jgi:hypothetical protein
MKAYRFTRIAREGRVASSAAFQFIDEGRREDADTGTFPQIVCFLSSFSHDAAAGSRIKFEGVVRQ